ncbi:MAG: thiamine-phosphate kinase [candidate division Zixibacteria bacterium RBG_16_40_9]|nr:MAG: thiamine-phosphate kinase [candidate division Zixibacteria bacterium RBG_16_40_9]
MELKTVGEFGLIDLIKKKVYSRNKRILVGIGDDAAIVKSSLNKHLILTTDTLLEKIHFDLDYFTFRQLGQRALAANLSDIAAMGGLPITAIVTLGLPNYVTVENVLELYAGMNFLAKKFNCPISGGDITNSPRGLLISISVLGEVEKNYLTLRSKAQAGDVLCVTGDLGEVQAGLELLQKAKKNKKIKLSKNLVQKHLTPLPKILESREIIKNLKPTAMIDVSDGLGAEVNHIAEESKLGAVIYESEIPISPQAKQVGKILNKKPINWALYGGEEYELLFTLPKSRVDKLIELSKEIKLTLVGEMKKEMGVFLVKNAGKKEKIKKGGFRHF